MRKTFLELIVQFTNEVFPSIITEEQKNWLCKVGKYEMRVLKYHTPRESRLFGCEFFKLDQYRFLSVKKVLGRENTIKYKLETHVWLQGKVNKDPFAVTEQQYIEDYSKVELFSRLKIK